MRFIMFALVLGLVVYCIGMYLEFMLGGRK